MIRRPEFQTILTLVVLLTVFALTRLRSNHWQVPSPANGWRATAGKRAPAGPEDRIYALFDAARAGNGQAYLDCFSGPLRDQVAATAREDAKFKQYLISQNSSVQGMAVTVTDRSNPEEARVRVEYVYADHNEVQNVRLTREGAEWKIVSMDGAQPVQPIVPYGAKAGE